MTEHGGYDATRDSRTGRPVVALDQANARKADVESQALTEDDNQGIALGDEASGEEDDLNPGTDDDGAAPSSVDINSTVPRMRAAANADDSDIDGEGEVDDLLDEPILFEEKIEGERPEALAKFAEVARNDDGRPVRNGVEATPETAPIPTDPILKQDAATRVLREGVLKTDQGAEEAIDKLPDRTDVLGSRTRGS